MDGTGKGFQGIPKNLLGLIFNNISLNRFMRTFKEFHESKEDSNEDEKALEVVRKGMNLQRGSDFWSDMISLCGNADGMASLLDVPKEKITGLASKINKLKNKIDSSDSESSKDKLIKTGEKI